MRTTRPPWPVPSSIAGKRTPAYSGWLPAYTCLLYTSQVVYSTKLDQYLLFMTTQFPGAAEAAIGVYISDDPTDFTQSKGYAVSPSMNGQQYPTVVDLSLIHI